MSSTSTSVLLIMDCQVGSGDQAFAHTAMQRAEAALHAARRFNIPVLFTVIDFLPGYADVAESNTVFAAIKAKHLLAPGTGEVIPALTPSPVSEPVLRKNRFNAFCGNALTQWLRSGNADHLILAGVSTSGVVLSTFAATIDLDYKVTILSDACADPDTTLQDILMTRLFPRSATVLAVDAWVSALK